MTSVRGCFCQNMGCSYGISLLACSGYAQEIDQPGREKHWYMCSESSASMHLRGPLSIFALQRKLLTGSGLPDQSSYKHVQLLPTATRTDRHTQPEAAARVGNQTHACHTNKGLGPYTLAAWTQSFAHHGSFFCTALAGGDAHAQHGRARVAHDGLHVCKVHIHQPWNGDDV